MVEISEKQFNRLEDKIDGLVKDMQVLRECWAAMPSIYVTKTEYEKLETAIDQKVSRDDSTIAIKRLEESIKATWKIFGVIAAVVGFIVSIADRIIGWIT